MILRFPTERARARAELTRDDLRRARLGRTPVAPQALATAVADALAAGLPADAVEAVKAMLPRILRTSPARSAEALALMARLDLPPSVRATVRLCVVPVRRRVLGAEWWLRAPR
jgi:hypothetical protein